MAKDNRWYFVNPYIGESNGFSDFPSLPGNYAIYTYNLFTKEKKLFYIGTAQNLRIRLLKHEVVKILRAMNNTIIIKC